MNRSIKLLGLMAATAMVLPMGQAAGHPPKPIEIEIEAPENLELKQAQPNAESRPPSEGTLAEGDLVLREDGRRFDSYSFQGEAGTTLRITVTSEAFAPFVFLVDRTTGETIAQQTGDPETVSLTVQLPNDGEYWFGIAATVAPGEGAYQFNVSRVQEVVNSVNSREQEARQLLSQGVQYANQNQFQEAIESWGLALAIFQDIEDPLRGYVGQLVALNYLGRAYIDLGQPGKSFQFYQESLIISEIMIEAYGERDFLLVEKGRILRGLGLSYISLGQYESAVDFLSQALTIFDEYGFEDLTDKGETLNYLGIVYQETGNHENAIMYHEQALAISRAVNDRTLEAAALGNLGASYIYLGLYEQAIALYSEALAITIETSARVDEGRAIGGLGVAYLSLGQYEKALRLQDDALIIARETNNRIGEGSALGNLGRVYMSLGRYDLAIRFYEGALVIYRESNNQSSELLTLLNLGFSYTHSSQYSVSQSSEVQ